MQLTPISLLKKLTTWSRRELLILKHTFRDASEHNGIDDQSTTHPHGDAQARSRIEIAHLAVAAVLYLVAGYVLGELAISVVALAGGALGGFCYDRIHEYRQRRHWAKHLRETKAYFSSDEFKREHRFAIVKSEEV